MRSMVAMHFSCDKLTGAVTLCFTEMSKNRPWSVTDILPFIGAKTD